jgi:hypothetical protein
VNLNQHGNLWIVAKYSIVQVSCIHTCQGLEVHYKSVIIRPDPVVWDGEVRTVPATRDCHYRSIRSYKTGISSDPVAVTCETQPNDQKSIGASASQRQDLLGGSLCHRNLVD